MIIIIGIGHCTTRHTDITGGRNESTTDVLVSGLYLNIYPNIRFYLNIRFIVMIIDPAWKSILTPRAGVSVYWHLFIADYVFTANNCETILHLRKGTTLYTTDELKFRTNFESSKNKYILITSPYLYLTFCSSCIFILYISIYSAKCNVSYY